MTTTLIMLINAISICLMALAFVVTALVYPIVLRFAQRNNIVDNPNARKLQRVPVPVMGGTTVFAGMLVAVVVLFVLNPDPRIWKLMSLLTIMYLIGVLDDIKDVAVAFRFVIEFAVVWLMILLLDVKLNNFYGLFGIYVIPDTVSIPLSLIAGVGIINAINMIDGIDGYCSSFGIMVCATFAVLFHIVGDSAMFTFAIIVIGALIPFFFHNVFGYASKMFLGDGGSLMLGTMLTFFVFYTLSDNSLCAKYEYSSLSIPALALAILAVPVFDTIKVMIVRMANGLSPFSPDKRHLHHVFIDLNYTHLATSVIIVCINLFICAALLAGWSLGLGKEGQFFLVIALSLVLVWGFYFFISRERQKNGGAGSQFFRTWSGKNHRSNLSLSRTWLFVRDFVDGSFIRNRRNK